MTGIVITMYDEADIVAITINNCRERAVRFVIVHSFNGVEDESLEFIKRHSIYIRLPNLGDALGVHEIGSAAICRNYNVGFERLYHEQQFDYVIGMTGDTLIKNIETVLKLTESGHLGYVLQAKGQPFYGKDDKPEIDEPSRMQTEEVNDIMPQFFLFDGSFAHKHKLFTKIVNTNKYTSEENLGNEIMRALDDMSRIRRIHTNPDVYDYYDGVQFQLKGLGHTRKK